MTRIVYLNGNFVDERNASVSIFDRGFLFADSVYEVTAVLDGRLVDKAAHLRRLARSLREIGIAAPLNDDAIVSVQNELIRRNDLREGIVYVQISRGAADRDLACPRDVTPSVVMFTQARAVREHPAAARGLRIMSIADVRWGRCDIKTTALLAASMAKQQALDNGYDDAWFHEDGFVTEGSSSNAYIVDSSGAIVTRALGCEILAGVTRLAILQLSQESGIPVIERAFSLDEVRSAREAFITSASTIVLPVVAIDGTPIGDGKPGPVAIALRRAYLDMVDELHRIASEDDAIARTA